MRIEQLRRKLSGFVAQDLPLFCLERWQSLHENYARILLSESGVEPLTLGELENMGINLSWLEDTSLGYGWTRGSDRLREALSGLYNGIVKPEGFTVANGSAEANLATVLAVVKPGDTVALDMPNYMQIYGLLKWIGARVVEVWRKPSESWRLSLDDWVRVIEEEKPRAGFITDPNNPTGQYLAEKELGELLGTAEKKSVRMVFDEVYWGSEQEHHRPSAIELGGPEEVVMVSGLSKVYGLPGLRIGWAAASEALSERIWSVKDYTSIAPCRLSDELAWRILSNRSIVEDLWRRARRIVSANLDTLLEALDSVPVKIHRPRAGAFVLMETRVEDTLTLSSNLYMEHGILVNPGECFKLPGYLRIGLGSSPGKFKDEVKELAKALSSLLQV